MLKTAMDPDLFEVFFFFVLDKNNIEQQFQSLYSSCILCHKEDGKVASAEQEGLIYPAPVSQLLDKI